MTKRLSYFVTSRTRNLMRYFGENISLCPVFATAHVMASLSCLVFNLDGLNLVIAIAVYDYLDFFWGSSYCGTFICHTVVFTFSAIGGGGMTRCFLTSRCLRGSTGDEIVINVRSKRFVTSDLVRYVRVCQKITALTTVCYWVEECKLSWGIHG